MKSTVEGLIKHLLGNVEVVNDLVYKIVSLD